MKRNELYYAGKKVRPSKFISCEDYRRLVGYCKRCGCRLVGRAAVPAPDPFLSDVYDDKTPVVQCELCQHESCWEI